MFSDNKKLRNEEKHFIKIIFLKKHYVFYSITVKQADKIFIDKLLIYERNFHRIISANQIFSYQILPTDFHYNHKVALPIRISF